MEDLPIDEVPMRAKMAECATLFRPTLAAIKSLLLMVLISIVNCSGLALPAVAATVPFVGCTGGGVASPSTPPTGGPVQLNIPSNIASKLAFYGAENTGILAPRGWVCSRSDGIDFRSLAVYPSESAKSEQPIVEISSLGSDSVGNANVVAAYGCRYFPNSAYGNMDGCRGNPASSEADDSYTRFYGALASYHTDRIQYINDFFLSYITPRDTPGLGTLLLYTPNQRDD
jgi:hypothetical protein